MALHMIPLGELLVCARPIIDDVSMSCVLEHISPYVVLVLDDNSYGLMVSLSYIYRICP